MALQAGAAAGALSGIVLCLAMLRGSFLLLLVGALCSGLQPLFFFEWPGRADVLMNMALLVLLLSGRKLWRGRVPEPYTSAPEIDEAQQVHVVGGKGGS